MGPDDLLGFELGTEAGFVIFTDRDGGRIERAALGGRRDPALFDVTGSVDEIAAFVVERDPERIALNFSDVDELDTIPDAHLALIGEAFDEDLAGRFVSADRLIADFLAGRTMAEVALYGRLLMDTNRIIEDEFGRIVPGETALRDLSGYVFVGDPDSNEEHNTDYVIQGGDLVGIFHDAEMMDFMQHNGFYGYVLRDGETELPPEILRLWDQAMQLRDLFRRNIAAGLTGAENHQAVVARIEEAGYIHIEENSYDTTADPSATQVYIDFSCPGAPCIRRVRAPYFGDRLGAGADDTAVPHVCARIRNAHACSRLGRRRAPLSRHARWCDRHRAGGGVSGAAAAGNQGDSVNGIDRGNSATIELRAIGLVCRARALLRPIRQRAISRSDAGHQRRLLHRLRRRQPVRDGGDAGSYPP